MIIHILCSLYVLRITVQSARDAEQATGSSSSLSMVSSFASTVTFSLVKNVKKYAEVGYQRLMVALPSRVTADDMIQFTKLISTLCDKCQVMPTYEYTVAVKP